jgi:transposase-like protein
MVHKTTNVLNKTPKGSQPKAKGMLHEIYLAEGREKATKSFARFVKTYEAKYTKATECLSKTRDMLLTFYDFPSEQWPHVRTTNPIESTFSTVRLRHRKTKGGGSRKACLTMVFKLMESASKSWRLLNGASLLKEVIAGGRLRGRSEEERRRPRFPHPRRLTMPRSTTTRIISRRVGELLRMNASNR